MTTSKVTQKENKITILIDPTIYSLEAIYSAAYIFIDKAYLFLEKGPKNQVAVSIKGKEKLTLKELKDLSGEFHNELLNCALRDKISKNNQKIREYVVARALMSAAEEENKPLMKTKKEVWQKDTLGIAIPWEEKYGNKTIKKQKRDLHSSPY